MAKTLTNTILSAVLALLACAISALGVAPDACAREAYEKQAVPTIEKYVSIDEGDYAKAAWAVIGDTPLYRLEIALPSRADAFSPYPMTVHDTLPPGIELDADTPLQAQMRGDTGQIDDISTTYDADTRMLAVYIPDAYPLMDDEHEKTLVLSYAATVLDDAQTGKANPNTNIAYLEYPADDGSKARQQSVHVIADVYVPSAEERPVVSDGGSLFDKTGNLLGFSPLILALCALCAVLVAIKIRMRLRFARPGHSKQLNGERSGHA